MQAKQNKNQEISLENQFDLLVADVENLYLNPTDFKPSSKERVIGLVAFQKPNKNFSESNINNTINQIISLIERGVNLNTGVRRNNFVFKEYFSPNSSIWSSPSALPQYDLTCQTDYYSTLFRSLIKQLILSNNVNRLNEIIEAIRRKNGNNFIRQLVNYEGGSDEYKSTPLMEALCWKWVKQVEFPDNLIFKGEIKDVKYNRISNINGVYNKEPNDEMVRLLLEYGANPNTLTQPANTTFSEEFKTTPLNCAIEILSVNSINSLIEHGLNRQQFKNKNIQDVLLKRPVLSSAVNAGDHNIKRDEVYFPFDSSSGNFTKRPIILLGPNLDNINSVLQILLANGFNFSIDVFNFIKDDPYQSYSYFDDLFHSQVNGSESLNGLSLEDARELLKNILSNIYTKTLNNNEDALVELGEILSGSGNSRKSKNKLFKNKSKSLYNFFERYFKPIEKIWIYDSKTFKPFIESIIDEIVPSGNLKEFPKINVKVEKGEYGDKGSLYDVIGAEYVSAESIKNNPSMIGLYQELKCPNGSINYKGTCIVEGLIKDDIVDVNGNRMTIPNTNIAKLRRNNPTGTFLVKEKAQNIIGRKRPNNPIFELNPVKVTEIDDDEEQTENVRKADKRKFDTLQEGEDQANQINPYENWRSIVDNNGQVTHFFNLTFPAMKQSKQNFVMIKNTDGTINEDLVNRFIPVTETEYDELLKNKRFKKNGGKQSGRRSIKRLNKRYVNNKKTKKGLKRITKRRRNIKRKSIKK